MDTFDFQWITVWCLLCALTSNWLLASRHERQHRTRMRQKEQGATSCAHQATICWTDMRGCSRPTWLNSSVNSIFLRHVTTHENHGRFLLTFHKSLVYFPTIQNYVYFLSISPCCHRLIDCIQGSPQHSATHLYNTLFIHWSAACLAQGHFN